jgi:hypothetical protein
MDLKNGTATQIMICLIALCGSVPALAAENGSHALSTLIYIIQ